MPAMAEVHQVAKHQGSAQNNVMPEELLITRSQVVSYVVSTDGLDPLPNVIPTWSSCNQYGGGY